MKCDSPLTVRLKIPIQDEKTGQWIYSVPVRCGKCLPCVQYRVNSWIFRMMEEVKNADTAYFCTFTYDTEHVPITDKGFMTLRKSDAKQYFLDLKKECKKRLKLGLLTSEELRLGKKLKPLVYYCCGEYGSKRRRPHLHAIILNALEVDIKYAWDKGIVDVLPCEIGAVKYVLKYIEKKKAKLFKNYDGEMEFSIFSRNIGKSYITDKVQDFFQKNLETNYLVKDGFKIPMPKYYRNRILTEDQKRKQIVVIKTAIDKADVENEIRINRMGMNYCEYLMLGATARYYKLLNLPDRGDI